MAQISSLFSVILLASLLQPRMHRAMVLVSIGMYAGMNDVRRGVDWNMRRPCFS